MMALSMAPAPMAPAGLAEFLEPRAAGRRVASFGLLWRRPCGRRLCGCGSLRLCGRLLGVCALPRPFWLPRCVCGSLRLSCLRSSAWGSSLPPFSIRERIRSEVACLCNTCLLAKGVLPAFGGNQKASSRRRCAKPRVGPGAFAIFRRR